jgi:lipid-A-disaccharide synthase-like uncharacterized protein
MPTNTIRLLGVRPLEQRKPSSIAVVALPERGELSPEREQDALHRGDPVFETLGVAGIVISMLAYVPQVVHLGRQHCSAGISRRAWAMWLVSSLLVGTLAVHRGDAVFILLQLSTLTSAAVILALAQRYRGMVCEVHALRSQPQNQHDRP